MNAIDHEEFLLLYQGWYTWKKGLLINDFLTGRSNHRSLHLLKLASAYQEGSPIVFLEFDVFEWYINFVLID